MSHNSITTVATNDELEKLTLNVDRGTIVRITFEIVYPDKSKKIVTYDQEWISKLSAIHFQEATMGDKEKKLFEAKPDWMDNPAFIKVSADGLMAGSCCKRPGHAGDDCWTFV